MVKPRFSHLGNGHASVYKSLMLNQQINYVKRYMMPDSATWSLQQKMTVTLHMKLNTVPWEPGGQCLSILFFQP